jgi:hypothetical protein
VPRNRLYEPQQKDQLEQYDNCGVYFIVPGGSLNIIITSFSFPLNVPLEDVVVL